MEPIKKSPIVNIPTSTKSIASSVVIPNFKKPKSTSRGPSIDSKKKVIKPQITSRVVGQRNPTLSSFATAKELGQRATSRSSNAVDKENINTKNIQFASKVQIKPKEKKNSEKMKEM